MNGPSPSSALHLMIFGSEVILLGSPKVMPVVDDDGSTYRLGVAVTVQRVRVGNDGATQPTHDHGYTWDNRSHDR